MAIGVTLIVMCGVVAVAILTRQTTEPQSEWARSSNDVCSRMADAYRSLNTNAVAAEPGTTLPLRELARIRRAGALIQQDAVTELRSSPLPGGYPQIAVAAFEGKVRLEWEAVRAAERRDRAAFDRAMQRTVAPVLEAKQAFDRSGADVCSALM